MKKQDKATIKDTIKQDAELAVAYKNLLKAKSKGQLQADIKPEEYMVKLVSKYGINAADLVNQSLSAPGNVMKACNQKFAAASGTLKYLATHDISDKEISKITNKPESVVKRNKIIKGTQLPKVTAPQPRRTLSPQLLQARQNQRRATQRTTQRATQRTTQRTTASPARPSLISATNPATSAKFHTPWTPKEVLQKEERESLYAACKPSPVTGQTKLKDLMEKGLVTQKDIQALYNEKGKEFIAGIESGTSGKKLVTRAKRVASGNRCSGGCLSGVQTANPDVPWGNDPAWSQYKRPGQDANWACDTYKLLETKGYATITIPNSAYGESRTSAGADRVRNTVARFPAGTTVSFDNQLDERARNGRDYHGLIRNAENDSAKCGHVATITSDGLCSDGFQSHNNGYDPSRYGREIHFSLAPDTQISADLAKELIAKAQERRMRETAQNTENRYFQIARNR